MKISIYSWTEDFQYQKQGKYELGYHMGSKKNLRIDLALFQPSSDEVIYCVTSKSLRKSCTKDV